MLSLHFFLAGDDRLAWRYSVIAARRAESAYANVEASRFFRRAIDAGRRLSEVTQRDLSSLHEALGDVRERLGDYPGALAAYRAARRAMPDEPLLVAQLLLKEAVVTSRAGGTRSPCAGPATADAPRDAPRSRRRGSGLACRPGTPTSGVGRDGAPRRSAGPGGDRGGQGLGRAEALASAYRTLDLTNVELGRYEDVTHYPLALAIYEELGDLDQCATVNDLGAFAYYQGGGTTRSASTRRRATSGSGLAIPSVAIISANVAEILSDRGQLDEAERMAVRLSASGGGRFEVRHRLRAEHRRPGGMPVREVRGGARAVGTGARSQPRDRRRARGARERRPIAECLAMQGRASEALELATEALARSETLGGPATPSSKGFGVRPRPARPALRGPGGPGGERGGSQGPRGRVRGGPRAPGARPGRRDRGSSDAPELDARYRAIFERLGVVAAPMIPIGRPRALSP